MPPATLTFARKGMSDAAMRRGTRAFAQEIRVHPYLIRVHYLQTEKATPSAQS